MMMNRNLLTQIKNEGRDNLWLVVEFTIVAVVVWMLTVSLHGMFEAKNTELGYDIQDVYRISVRQLPEDNPKYVHDIDNHEDLRTLIANIRKSPYVEVAGFSYNALPYTYNYMGNRIFIWGQPDSIQYGGNMRSGSPEIARVLRLRSQDHTPEQLEQMLARGGMFISGLDPKWYDKKTVEWVDGLVGERAFFGDSTKTYPIMASIAHMRRNDFELNGGTIFLPLNEQNNDDLDQVWEIGVRVKPGMGKKFEDEFYANPDMRRMRNTYLSQLKDMTTVRALIINSQEGELRLYIAGIIFMLVIIFLGLLGTFWFRIRQRTGEIALRKTCGATASQIFRRIISEGLILLGVALIPALFIGVGVLYYYFNPEELSFSKIDWAPYAWCYGLTAVIMAVIIIIGVIVPARRAMKIEPALALKEE